MHDGIRRIIDFLSLNGLKFLSCILFYIGVFRIYDLNSDYTNAEITLSLVDALRWLVVGARKHFNKIFNLLCIL
jgi:hypothetical protein